MMKLILLLAVAAIGQIYENPNLHGRYEPPSGWVMDKPVASGNVGVTFKTTRVGLQPVTIQMWKFQSEWEAISYSQASCFLNLANVYKASSSYAQAPIASSLADTVYPSGRSFSGLDVKHLQSGVVSVISAVTSGPYFQLYTFATTISDYETNGPLYSAVFVQGLSFYTPTVLAKPSAISTQVAERKSFVDALGRGVRVGGEGRKAPGIQDDLIFRR